MEQFCTAPRFKINLMNCLLDRCYKICSSCEIISDEFEQIKTMLSINGYPKYVLDKCIRELFNRKFTNHYVQRKKTQSKKDSHSFAVFRCLIRTNS